MNTSVRNTARLLAAGLRALLVLTLLTGAAYPLAVTGLAQTLFPRPANGSLTGADGRTVGSTPIGQAAPRDLFQGRPAAGLTVDHGMPISGASNLAADSPVLLHRIAAARARVARDNAVRPQRVPADAVTSSASGLDPDISPQYAALQAPRVAARTGLPLARVKQLVRAHTEGRTLGFMGEPRVNVLALNTAVEALLPRAERHARR